jgi:hypothetical protein
MHHRSAAHESSKPSGVLDPQAAGREQFIEIVVVLVVLVLGDDEQAAAAFDEVEHAAELGAQQFRRIRRGRALSARGAGMGEHQQVGVAEQIRVQWLLDVAPDAEITRRRQIGGPLHR